MRQSYCGMYVRTVKPQIMGPLLAGEPQFIGQWPSQQTIRYIWCTNESTIFGFCRIRMPKSTESTRRSIETIETSAAVDYEMLK